MSAVGVDVRYSWMGAWGLVFAAGLLLRPWSRADAAAVAAPSEPLTARAAVSGEPEPRLAGGSETRLPRPRHAARRVLPREVALARASTPERAEGAPAPDALVVLFEMFAGRAEVRPPRGSVP